MGQTPCRRTAIYRRAEEIMATSMNAILDEWIEKNTIHCPVGKITTKMCEELRKRPSIGDEERWNDFRRRKDPKPTVCETCAGWQEYLRSPSTNNGGKETKMSDESNPWKEMEKQKDMVEHDDQPYPTEHLSAAAYPISGFQYHCEKHGPHNGGKIGRAFSKKCPLCVNETRKNKQKKTVNLRRLETASKIVAETSADLGMTTTLQVLDHPITDVPALPKGVLTQLSGSGISNNSLPTNDMVIAIDFTSCPWLLDFIKGQSALPVSLYIKRHFLEMLDPEDAKTVLMTQII